MLLTEAQAPITRVAVENPIQTAAREGVRNALEYTRGRLGKETSALERLVRGDLAAHEYFRYALSSWIGTCLSRLEDTVTSVYLVDAPDRGESIAVTEPLALILVVERKTAALESLLGELDAALTRQYREVMTPHADGLTSLLAATLVDRGEASTRSGAGSLLHVLHYPPTRIWSR